MYKDDDTLTPRDRIGDDLLRRMLDGTESRLSEPILPDRHEMPHGNSCSIEIQWGLRDYPLASVYAPLQDFYKLYDRDTALKNGTLFSELNLPFMGESVKRGGCHHD